MHLPGEVRESLRLRTLDVPVTLTFHGTDATGLRAAVSSAWSRCVAPLGHAGDPLTIEVLLDESPAAVAVALQRGAVAGTDLDAVLDNLSSEVTRRAIERQSGSLVMLHAASLAHPVSGATALLVGESGAGKTTAAAVLGRELCYLSDETAGVTAALEVVPHPKPLSLASPGRDWKTQSSPDDLALLTAPSSAHVACVFLLARDVAASTPEIEEVATLDALVALAGQTSYLRALPSPLHRLAAVVQAGGCYRVRYAEAAGLLPVIAAHLDAA